MKGSIKNRPCRVIFPLKTSKILLHEHKKSVAATVATHQTLFLIHL
jgi:hypothetical protein